ncbi:MAG: leucine-rich repeat domain-containing protein, partial [Butyrivibrio sp.]|nr:leucine-rich repeat domain-containing protein [Butyrivibrio sp.]
GNYAFWRDRGYWGYGHASPNDNGFQIEKIYLPKTLKSIGEGAFGSMILTGDCKLVIPSSITELPKRAERPF